MIGIQEQRQSPEVERRIKETEEERKRVRTLVRSGRWREAELNSDRAVQYETHFSASPKRGAEAIIATNDLQPASYLLQGSQIRRAVAYVEVNDPRESTSGSGFLISPRLFITNAHVIRDIDATRGTQIVFDREATVSRVPNATTAFLLDPDVLALFSPED